MPSYRPTDDPFSVAWQQLFMVPNCPVCASGGQGPHPSPCNAESRFWHRVKFGPGCWEWQGFVKNSGYGSFSPRHGKTYTAHRFAFLVSSTFSIPEGLVVRHDCDNRLCVRPDHLVLGTQWDNVQDMMERGRARWSEPRPLKTHCKRGHEYSPENTAVTKEGRRCRTCRRMRG